MDQPESRQLKDILDRRERYDGQDDTKTETGLKAETLEQLMQKPIPQIERLVNPFVERYGFTLIGGTKGVGKSLFVTQLALHYASGKPGFLKSFIEKEGRVLLIQQEVSEAGMQDRLRKMKVEGEFDTKERFFQVTTTGKQLRLTNQRDLRNVRTLIEKTSPDILILDPFYTFFSLDTNATKDMSEAVSIFMELKSKYKLSLVVVHHFSNKAYSDMPKSLSGRFMGSSNLANAADVLIGLDFLPPGRKDCQLPLPYNHYASVETMTRHEEWPEKLYVERHEKQLLFHPSYIWRDMRKKITADEITRYITANGGQLPQQDVVEHFKEIAHPNTIRNTINEAEGLGWLSKDTIPGPHGKKMLKVIEH